MPFILIYSQMGEKSWWTDCNYGNGLCGCRAGNDPHDAGAAWGVPAFPAFPAGSLPLTYPSVTPCAAGAAAEQPTASFMSEKSKQPWSHSPGEARRPRAKSWGSDSLISPSHLTLPSWSLQKIHCKQCRWHSHKKAHGQGEGVEQFF